MGTVILPSLPTVPQLSDGEPGFKKDLCVNPRFLLPLALRWGVRMRKEGVLVSVWI